MASDRPTCAAARPLQLLRSARHPEHLKTPLIFAAWNQRKDVVELLLQDGADVNHADECRDARWARVSESQVLGPDGRLENP